MGCGVRNCAACACAISRPDRAGNTDRQLTHGAVYHCVLRKHVKAAGIDLGSLELVPEASKPSTRKDRIVKAR